ncbi:MAG: asparagine synthase (glutamine-hydrolyzing) [Bacteroidales bacterium]|nr:asparagine synthase (glutamine-hydrolyzing) [Bacteroidales bacterium]
MCGICGIVSPSGNFDAGDVRQMCSVLKHRGPDAQGVEGLHAILGHARLSIIDLSAQANQPMISHNGRYSIAFNGEIYNYREIASKLSKERNVSFSTHSDTEVILEAFCHWGVDFVRQLNGMFAIAISENETGRLFLFRDRIGIKPMYYYHDGLDFVFASELKAITSLQKIKKHLSISQKAVELFMHLGYIPAPFSIYDEVKKFPQGCYAEYYKGEMRLETYWKPDSVISPSPVTNEQEALEELYGLVNSSVSYRLIADVPYGTFLSGGIDSSLVTAFAARNVPGKLKTFSIAFSDARYNEAPFAAKVASYLNTDHHELTVTENDAREIIPLMPAFFDEPFADTSAIPTFLLSKLTKQYVTMALSGDGGDELFHGYGAYHWANRLSNPYFKMASPVMAQVLAFGNNRQRRVSNLLKITDKELLPAHIFSQEQYFFRQKELESLLVSKGQGACVPVLPSTLPSWYNGASKQAFFDLTNYLPDDLLVKVDRCSMAVALEARVPLLDYRIVEFALRLHPDLKIKGDTQKYLLKQLLFQLVPQELFNRPKWGFSIPLAQWMKSSLRPLVLDTLNEDAIKRTGFFQAAKVKQLLKNFEKTENEFLYNRIWLMVAMQQWAEKNKL